MFRIISIFRGIGHAVAIAFAKDADVTIVNLKRASQRRKRKAWDGTEGRGARWGSLAKYVYLALQPICSAQSKARVDIHWIDDVTFVVVAFSEFFLWRLGAPARRRPNERAARWPIFEAIAGDSIMKKSARSLKKEAVGVAGNNGGGDNYPPRHLGNSRASPP